MRIIIPVTLCLVTVMMIGVIGYDYFYQLVEGTYERSTIDGNLYYIMKPGPGTPLYFGVQSANALAEINIRVQRLIDTVAVKYAQDSTYGHIVKILQANYNYKIISEAAIDKRYTTYTIDKESVHICLRTRDTSEQVYDTNTLMYVVIHELAHLCNYDKKLRGINGHGQEFKNIFRMLTREAMTLNIYEYIDYSKTPQEYCGIVINSSIV
jgi:hypothetical protein